jgi:hypothetical protein
MEVGIATIDLDWRLFLERLFRKRRIGRTAVRVGVLSWTFVVHPSSQARNCPQGTGQPLRAGRPSSERPLAGAA